MVIQNDRGARKMLIFDSPESDVFLSAGDQPVSLNRAELYSQDIEVTDLFGQKNGLSGGLYLTDIEDKHSLTLVGIQTHHCQTLFVTQSDLLDLLVGALETTDAFVINPYPD